MGRIEHRVGRHARKPRAPDPLGAQGVDKDLVQAAEPGQRGRLQSGGVEAGCGVLVTLQGKRAVQDQEAMPSVPAVRDVATCVGCGKALRLAKPRNSKTDAPEMVG